MGLLNGLLRDGFTVSLVKWRFWGCPSMIKDPKKLSMIQDQVWENPQFHAETLKDGMVVTHCNASAHAVARAYGCLAFLDLKTNAPYMADEIYDLMGRSSDFAIKRMDECQALVNQGVLIFAALPSYKLGESHGHIVSLTPGNEEFSGTWNAKTPACLNLGGVTTSFRNKGINWAFPVKKGIPDFFAWGPSL